jgi:hypothetical protein
VVPSGNWAFMLPDASSTSTMLRPVSAMAGCTGESENQ